MPIYNLVCRECGHNYKDLIKGFKEAANLECPSCGATENQYQSIPSGGHAQVMETADKSRGVKVRKDNEKKLRDRMNKHHDKHEVIDKIDKYGMDDAEKFGWLSRAKKK